jgi:hypothetical protein
MSGGWQKRARTIALVTGSIALVTCAQLAEGEDAQVLGPALSALGMRSCWQVWDGPAVDWSAFDLAVLRSTWDYPADRHRFVAWAESVPRLANAVDVVAWNSDKRYLHDVAPDGPTGLFVPERITSHRPDPEELGLGGRVMALLRERFGGDLLYARVDVVPTPGGPVVLELELIEPSLFLQYDQDAAARFAAAVRRRL